MTVQSTTARADYQGNGVTTLFTVPFYFLDPSHVKVLRTDKSTTPPTTATLVLTTDYVLTGTGVQSGGSVQTTLAPTATQVLTVLRNVPFTQLVHYVPNDPFPAATHEQALDQLTMELQQISEAQTHSLQLPTYEAVPATIPPAATRAGTVLGFDSTGAITYLPIPASVGAGDLRNEAWTTGTDYTAGTSTFVTLTRAYGSKANLGTVVMAGIAQDPTTYSLTNVGTTLQFDSVIPAGVNRIWCVGGTTISLNTPATGSVGDATLATGSQMYGLVNYHWRVRTDPNNNYDGVTQSTFPEASPLIYAADGESFGWSMRNSKHTAFELYNSINGATTQFYDTVQGVASLVAGSTIGQATGVAGYIKNACATSGGHPNAVALFGLGTAEVNGANTWGLNTLLQDSAVRAVGAGINRLLLGYECDINVMNPGTQVIGISVGGNGLSQPSAANAFIANSLGSNIQWGTAFWSTDGNAARSLVTGRNAALAPNVASQQMWWDYGDFAGVSQIGILQFVPAGGAAPGGAWVFSGTAKSGITVNNGDLNAVSGVYRVASTQVVGAQVPGYGTPLNGTRQSGFNASTATLSQTAAQLAALLVDLKAHGLIGA